jgi:hypothetical protein
MTSVIVYGRNDHHGYNYHKRVSLSLNCIAQVLTHPTDEILFVDYNTPDHFPTLIEAIQDTLTPNAKKRLKIFRVRPHQHPNSLPISEALARNVAIRRSNPSNKWILSSNPDMIFIPVDPSESLSTLIATLPDSFYLLPRFSLPECLWEQALERSKPEENISFLRDQNFHLNTTVRKPGFLKYDNPGDFQLLLRKDIFHIRGFDENMTKGWHLDSNLSKRMSLLRATDTSLETRLIAFHCNHNLQDSFIHKRTSVNSWDRFINQVSDPVLSNPHWGLPNESIEEISLSRPHIAALASTISQSKKKTPELLIDFNSYNTLTYSPERIFSYLADHLSHLPKTTRIGYLGHNSSLVSMVNDYIALRGFTEKITPIKAPLDASQTSLIICDFGFDENSPIGKTIKETPEGYLLGRKTLKKTLQLFLKLCRHKKALKQETQFIGINVLHTDYNIVFSTHLITTSNGHSTGICYGMLPIKEKHTSNKLMGFFYYFIARYLYDYSDRIRFFIKTTKLSTKLFKDQGN